MKPLSGSLFNLLLFIDMKTIYSILYVTFNTALNERVGIGLLMSNGLDHQFKFSPEKLLIVKNILDDERYLVVRNYLKSIERELSIGEEQSSQLFAMSSVSEWINERYLGYLSNYSNNIIQFSNPKTIDIELNPSNFKRIFEKYIFRYGSESDEPISIDVYARVNQNLFPKIEGRVNLTRTLTSADFENLFSPIEVDFIGINGTPVAGQTIDFEKKHYNLENDVARFVSLTKAVELSGHLRGKYFVLGREPQRATDPKGHQLWERIRDSDFLDFVDVDEVGVVAEYIVKNDVKPFFN